MVWREVALRQRPYGLGLVPEKEISEYTDPRNEAAIEARWRPVLDRLDIRMLEIRDVVSQPVRINVDGIDWDIAPMGSGPYNVPQTVYHRIRAAEAEGIPFAYWMWGEEKLTRPTFQPIREPVPVRSASPKRDPIVIGVIPTAPNRGIWCLLGIWLH